MNSLDGMNWQERFHAAFLALCAEQNRAAALELELAKLRRK